MTKNDLLANLLRNNASRYNYSLTFKRITFLISMDAFPAKIGENQSISVTIILLLCVCIEEKRFFN